MGEERVRVEAKGDIEGGKGRYGREARTERRGGAGQGRGRNKG